MQITLNQAEVSQVVLEYIQNQLALDDSNNFAVELHEDGITILVNEDSNGSTGQPSTGEKPAKKPRRSKAQIEAERLAAEAGKSSEPATVTTTAVNAQPVEPATPVVAGDTTPEASASPGTTQPVAQAEEPETPVDPQPEVAATVVVEDPANEPEPQVDQQPEPEVETQPKPTQSLFANLRRPKNT